MNGLQVAKVLNNNVIIANHPEHGEVVVIGKGIGFNRKPREMIANEAVEKLFILRNAAEQEQYKQLALEVDEKLIEVLNEILLYVAKHSQTPLNEHIHIALTDHIAFAIKRAEQDIAIHNPFLFETKEIYPEEYRLAEYAINMIRDKMGVDLGQDEIGFVALHIHSAMTNQHITEVKAYSQLIADMVDMIEQQMNFSIVRHSLDYARLLTHLRFAIERIRRGEKVHELGKLEEVLKDEYPELYDLAWKLTKVMEKRLHKPVYQAEISYLTMHLNRIVPRHVI
ncbi:glucose PTS transporter transcription antiterminator GlcT [Paenibacillus physcomitrellae]|uniref:PtsGHI operon antiterminator n=1 Tax=Paenibacillus physcomitrellae TaxID=1619311 RepID=A0ABQ1GD40_9BACL|nr:PRD domain-containing protein [Paenibacillus physcomitrellae]GGA41410.1 PtsGHI operon antiterminator [Paenibacillus physcomitrellae]